MIQRDVLLVEDDRALRLTLTQAMETEGYRVTQTGNLKEATEQFSAMIARSGMSGPDLMIVDLGLPDGEGEQLIRWVRSFSSSLPIIIISARYDDNSKVNLLDAGADDYLVKPFSISELLARLRVALRHRHAGGSEPVEFYRHHGVEIDLARHRVLRDGEGIRLTPTEFRLLARLVRQAGQVVTHRQLLQDVWGPEFVEHTHYLRLYMAQLRSKLETDPARPALLLTEPGVGYRLSGDI
ncbi:MAG: hypothetical protein RL001_2492 [Pseudomonadota bacterium]